MKRWCSPDWEQDYGVSRGGNKEAQQGHDTVSNQTRPQLHDGIALICGMQTNEFIHFSCTLRVRNRLAGGFHLSFSTQQNPLASGTLLTTHESNWKLVFSKRKKQLKNAWTNWILLENKVVFITIKHKYHVPVFICIPFVLISSALSTSLYKSKFQSTFWQL